MSENTLQSMTGFGRAENNEGDNYVMVEIKSLNGKQHDLNLRMPPLLKSYEFDIRTLVGGRLQRGTVECSIVLKLNGATKPVSINTDLIRYYYQSVQGLSEELNLDTSQVLNALLRLPEVVTPMGDGLDEANWLLVKQTLLAAIDDLQVHRAEEGGVLQQDIALRIRNIETQAKRVAELAPLRQIRLKESIERKLEEWVGKDKVDANRFEQELVYYIEKLDISEELLRLQNHCNYFFEIMSEADAAKGKKLGFLLQEIGREINTTGAKANDADIQKCVVLMKDELEKAKEQMLNVL